MRRTGLLLVGGELRPGHVEVAAGRIAAVELDPRLPAGGLPVVAPGLVDLHVHGFGGFEPETDLGGMARALARAGTTSFLPTLFPREPAELGRAAEAVWRRAQALGSTPGGAPVPEGGLGARVLGLHLEGPFVSPGALGGLPEGGAAEPSPAALRAILGPATGDGRGVRAMTLAPELPGAGELVRELARAGVRPSLGHSLATAREARAAAELGASGATHLFNAMRPFHHREAGLAGAALVDERLVPEVIGDLVHVGPEAFALALAARGPAGLCLVSDALAAAGTDAARFASHGRSCAVRDGAVWFEDPSAPGGRRLTGAATSQLDAVRALARRRVAPLAALLRMASEAPARALGLDAELGVLSPGARADLLVLSASDLRLEEVLVGGTAVPGGASHVPDARRLDANP